MMRIRALLAALAVALLAACSQPPTAPSPGTPGPGDTPRFGGSGTIGSGL